MLHQHRHQDQHQQRHDLVLIEKPSSSFLDRWTRSTRSMRLLVDTTVALSLSLSCYCCFFRDFTTTHNYCWSSSKARKWIEQLAISKSSDGHSMSRKEASISGVWRNKYVLIYSILGLWLTHTLKLTLTQSSSKVLMNCFYSISLISFFIP